MKKARTNTVTLGRLAFLTTFTLSGIIALQVYWLYASYREQKARFTADVENALTVVAIRAQLRPVTGAAPTSVDSVLTPFLGNMQQMGVGGSSVTIRFSDTSANGDGKAVPELPHPAPANEQQMDSLLGLYKQDLALELANRAIETPFELAFTDPAGHVLFATGGKEAFEHTPVKSLPNALFTNSMPLQAAFPDANLFLLRRMALVLGVSALLIVIGVFSFSYLLLLFFRQKKMSEIRNDFMNNMAHELKTPISAVSVALEVIGDDRRPLDETTRTEYLHIARGELQRLSLLVDKVLKTAAFDRSEVLISKTEFLARPWLNETLQSLKPLLEASNAQVQVILEPESLLLFADKTHLTNVLQNLLDNAIKYNDKAQPQITVSLTGNAEVFTLTVTDNGKGIPAAYTDKVFDQFFRIPAGDRHDTKGYGLGLSYVKSIVTLHGGGIHLRSREREGSTFTLQFPQNR